MKPLALFVWENVLHDHTEGIAFALARSEAAAWRALKAKDEVAFDRLAGAQWSAEPGRRVTPPISERPYRPVRIDRPEAFTCWGGG